MTIDQLPSNATVKIYTLSGALVRELTASDLGVVTWDAKDAGGTFVPSGVYFGLASAGGDTKTFKIVVQR